MELLESDYFDSKQEFINEARRIKSKKYGNFIENTNGKIAKNFNFLAVASYDISLKDQINNMLLQEYEKLNRTIDFLGNNGLGLEYIKKEKDGSLKKYLVIGCSSAVKLIVCKFGITPESFFLPSKMKKAS